ncbi:polyamine ABC transporter substrate-binding protein [Parathalassolituus penaei]|uniref:Putrescine-binding periplasmic protein n=1 Tax=Parathalassolituus penaei TaxID=2997323 RepID=A0A9X3EQV2_9GAMM|nr:polyamine ABC transporter substrate-binding protein [Parathalassolituus penaei]MCY0967213.1 polyamine ABC transporter substrate-binding protein [Parathalassolituus penaei]
MKHIPSLLASACALAMSVNAVAEEKVLNIYNWSDYIYEGAIEEFTAKTGIKVNYDVYDSNETLEAKLMTGNTGYDIVVPTGSFLERQVQAGIYSEIDKTKLKNLGNLDANLVSKIAMHDPENKHNVPWAWGTIGMGYNVEKVKARIGEMPVDSLDLLFKPELSAKLADCGVVMLDSPAEIMAIALNYLGLDPNSEKKEDLEKGEALLKANRANYRYFHSSQFISDLANGEVCMSLAYNGDILQAQGRADEAGQGVQVSYVIPKEGTVVWFDLMAIPKDAKHKDEALQFIDFILEGKTAAGISNFVYYAVPNKAAEPMLNEDVRTNPGIYPSEEVKAKLFTQKAHTAKYDRLLTKAWSNVKTNR